MAVNVAVGLGLAAAGTVLFFLWLPWARHRSHKEQEPPDAGPATMELRPEPPALVNLLVHELDLTGDAFAATLFDLGARHHVDIIELSPEENLVVPKQAPAADAVLPYEQDVLDVVREAAHGGPHATVPAIAAAIDPSSANKWFVFKQHVMLDAQSRGLIGKAKSGRGTNTIMVLSALPPLGFLVAIPQLWIVAPFLWVGLLLVSVILLVIGRSYVLTDAGRATAAHWLGVRDFIADHGSFEDLPPAAVAVWDRYLAYGAAMDLSDEAAHGLIRELRTSLSIGDVRRAASAMRAVMRAAKDPEANRAWRVEALKSTFATDVAADDIWGPSSDDFWTLAGNTMRAMTIATMTARADPALFRTASNARLAELQRAATPDIAADVHTLEPAARVVLQAMTSADAAARDNLGKHPMLLDPEVRAAASRLASLASTKLAADPQTQAMLQAASAGLRGA